MQDDLLAALSPVVAALEALGVEYRVGGSVASSALGVPRATADVDLVASLGMAQASTLAAAIGEAYYADIEMMRDAIRR